jgi:hypothetical protein
MSVGMADDLGIDLNTQFTPEGLVEAVDHRFSSLGVPVNLEGLRSLGYAFHENCYSRPNSRLRCTFWLWNHEGTGRGIELNVREDGFTRFGGPQVSAHYVYESSGR